MLISILIFSVFEVVTKTMNGSLTGMQLTFYRFIIGGMCLLPFGIRELKKRQFVFNAKYIVMFFLLGFMLVTVSMSLAQYGVFYSSAGLSAVLFSSNPLFISIFSVLLLKEKMNRWKILGLVIGLVGVLISCIHLISNNEISGRYIIGITCTLLGMIVFSIYSVINKKVSVGSIGPVAMTAISSICGAICCIPFLIVTGISTHENMFYFPVKSILPQFLFIGIVLTGLAYLLYYVALANLDTSIGSMAFLLKPPLASVWALIFLGETIWPNTIVGIILILVGVGISVKLGQRTLHHNTKVKERGGVYEKTRNHS